MGLVNGIFIFMILAVAITLAFFYKSERRWIAMTLTLSFLLRMLVVAILSGGLQYVFVIDSLEYELKARYLSQSWMTDDLRVSFNVGHINNYNLYDYFLSAMYQLFGSGTLLAQFANSLFATLTVLFMYLIRHKFLLGARAEKTLDFGSLFTVLLASIYPSYLIFSATNIRDPLYLLSIFAFLYFLFSACSRAHESSLATRVLSLAFCALSLSLILGIRGYIGGLLFASLGFGLVLYLGTRRLGLAPAVVLTLSFCAIGSFLLQELFPFRVDAALTELMGIRHNFSNAGFVEIYARSSFGLEQTFSSLGDVWLFLPNALAHYFYGPFPWEIADLVQGFSFIEAALIILLTWPTWIGLRLAYRRAPLVTTMLFAFLALFAVAQALAISNMGTIFRHRTLSILLLLIFTGEGVYVVAKKNCPTLFQT